MDDVAREAALLALKKETSNLPTRRELAWEEIKKGVNPRYVALKYQMDPEVLEAAAVVHRNRLESENAARDAAKKDSSDPT